MLRLLQRVVLFLVGLTLPILLVFGVLQFAIVTRRMVPDRKRVWMIVFALSYGISAVIAFSQGVTKTDLLIVSSTQAALIIYYFLIGFVVRTREDLVVLLWALAIGGAITAAPAALGIRTSTSEFEYGARASGLSGQENLFGFDMAVCLPVAIALLFAVRSQFGKLVAVGLASVCVVGLLLSLSRAAFVSAFVMGALWMYRSGRIDSVKYLVPAIGLALAVALLSPQSVQQRVRTMVNPSERNRDLSIQSRLAQTEFALKAFASNPLVGIGVNRFQDWAHQQPGGFKIDNVVHNAYLNVASSQGLLGLIPFVAILGLTWRDYGRCRRAARTNRRYRDASLAELGHYATFLQIALTGGMVGGLFGLAHQSKTMWLLLALSPVLVSLCRERVAALSEQAVARAQGPEAECGSHGSGWQRPQGTEAASGS